MTESIERTLGELSANVKTLVEGQSQILRTLMAHDRELSESRGSSKTNRWLSISFPPILLALWEIVKGSFHAGGHS